MRNTHLFLAELTITPILIFVKLRSSLACPYCRHLSLSIALHLYQLPLPATAGTFQRSNISVRLKIGPRQTTWICSCAKYYFGKTAITAVVVSQFMMLHLHFKL